MPNGRILHDLAVIKVPADLGVVISQPNWQLMTNEACGLGISRFHSKKSGTIETMSTTARKMERAAGREIKIWRQDNAGKNKALEARLTCEQVGMHYIKFEYTARKTPQQNSLVETKFPALAGRARAMCNAANLPRKVRYQVFTEALQTATKLDWLVVVESNGVKLPRVMHCQNEMPHWVGSLRAFGEAGTIAIGKNGKAGNRGVTMMFAGYSNDHGGDTVRMWNEKTKRITDTRDVTWLKRMYFEGTENSNMEEPLGLVARYVETNKSGERVKWSFTGPEAWESDAGIDLIPPDDHSVPCTRYGRKIYVPGRHDPTTGRDAIMTDEVNAVQNYANTLQAIQEEKYWTRIDEGINIFVTTKEGGPSWTCVIRRITEDLDTGNEIENVPTGGVSAKYLNWAQPQGVENIKTILVYHDPKTNFSAVQNVSDLFAELDNMELTSLIIVENKFLEFENVGAGEGGGFTNTSELRPMKLKETLAGPDAKEWKKEIKNEHERMLDNHFCRRVLVSFMQVDLKLFKYEGPRKRLKCPCTKRRPAKNPWKQKMLQRSLCANAQKNCSNIISAKPPCCCSPSSWNKSLVSSVIHFLCSSSIA